MAACVRGVTGGQTEGGRITGILQDLGYAVQRMKDGPWRPEMGSVLLILGNLYWYPRLARQLLSKPKAKLPAVALWHWEPLPPSKASGLSWPLPNWREVARIALRDRRISNIYTNYLALRRVAVAGAIDVLAVSTRGRAEFLGERGIHAHHLPLGYTPEHGRDLGISRDIDVLFLGDMKPPRRRELIANLQRRGLNVMVRGDWSNPEFWGENRTALINRARIFLNIQRFAGEFSGLRLILGMANKALVVSEPMYDSAPFVPGEHYVSASIEEMPGVIQRYLANEEERTRITERAYRFATEEMPLKRSVSRLLNLTQEFLDRKQSSGDQS
ncbi:MAG: glycosyltransferase family 1 protein [Bryobacteraceae bacterium]|nr:glycosyltransferase family 1 protein [Bryobacteraceae bacterium]